MLATARLARSNTPERYLPSTSAASLQGGIHDHSRAGCATPHKEHTLVGVIPFPKIHRTSGLAGSTPRYRKTPVSKASLLAIGLIAAGTSLTACGGGSSTPNAGAGSASGGTQGSGLLAYSSCMRAHGVPNFPDPKSNGGIDDKRAVIAALSAVSSSQANKAQNACQHLLPPGGSLSGQPTQQITAQDQQDYLHAAACMRSHGIIDFPDPTFSGGSVSFNIPASIDTTSTQFVQAQHTCQELIPAGLPYSTGSTG